MTRAYTAEQIAEIAELEISYGPYTEEQKSGMRVLSSFLLRHSACSDDELQEMMKGVRAPKS